MYTFWERAFRAHTNAPQQYSFLDNSRELLDDDPEIRTREISKIEEEDSE
jgi:hypothetical protein